MVACSQGSDFERHNPFLFIQRQEVAEKRITIVLIEEVMTDLRGSLQ